MLVHVSISYLSLSHIARLRIGHCSFSHVHLLYGSSAPICDTCGEPLWVQHLILQCWRFDYFRRTLALPGTIQEALSNDITHAKSCAVFSKTNRLLFQNIISWMCVCSNANPLHYYALRVPLKVDRWLWVWSVFESCTAWADHITYGMSICIVYCRKLRLGWLYV